MSISLAGGVRHPKIYAYTIDKFASTPWKGGRDGAGLIKVGETQRDVRIRIKEQLAAIKMPETTEPDLLLVEAAITDDGRVFSDTEVHKALVKAGHHNVTGEWFECTKLEVDAAIQAVRGGKDLPSVKPMANFPMRPEQAAAVELTAAYFRAHPRTRAGRAPDYLWNAKMRFGKTFSTYQLAKEMGWSRVLVLTYKPAVEQAWRDDLAHKDFAGWRFRGKDDEQPDLADTNPLIWFASFQDVLGKGDDGKAKIKNRDLFNVEWDAVVVDEYHFGAWRDAARSIYAGESSDIPGDSTEGDRSEAKVGDTPDLEEGFAQDIESILSSTLKVDHYLYLSGTPFRALTEGEFLEDQVYNWTYSDEQRAKQAWSDPPNPYAALPQMHLLAYEMPEALKDAALNNLSEFSLTEFFRTKKHEAGGEPIFVHENEVQRWLDLLRGQDLTDLWATVSAAHRPPMPFADVNLLTSLQHTVWYLPGIDACFAMRDLLNQSHNKFFRDYQIVVAAGSKAGMGQAALGPVKEAITSVPQDSKSITLSCGKLLTGVTVPAWTGIFMLRELKSPETYFQAAFRVQSPWSYKRVNTEFGGEDEVVVKEHCYVIDFSPNRALSLIVEYATKLRSTSTSGTDAEAALSEFMEFFPVLAFDGARMSNVNAGDVIDYLTRGISSSMLARRWNSAELITLDIKAMEAILADEELIKSLEQIEMFRNISDDLSAVISSNGELKKKKIAKGKPTPGERKEEDETKKRRKSIRDKLRRFLTRIPAFMYLTDNREKTIVDLITEVEPELFEKVTSLSIKDFERLVDAGVFDASRMNDAVWKFREFEEPSLRYGQDTPTGARVGGWNVTIDSRLGKLIDIGHLEPGTELVSIAAGVKDFRAYISNDHGILFGGLRHITADEAAAAASENAGIDGWSYWGVVTNASWKSLLELERDLNQSSKLKKH
jgi:hypothetical protein